MSQNDWRTLAKSMFMYRDRPVLVDPGPDEKVRPRCGATRKIFGVAFLNLTHDRHSLLLATKEELRDERSGRSGARRKTD